jgi:hypothetical protein
MILICLFFIICGAIPILLPAIDVIPQILVLLAQDGLSRRFSPAQLIHHDFEFLFLPLEQEQVLGGSVPSELAILPDERSNLRA